MTHRFILFHTSQHLSFTYGLFSLDFALSWFIDVERSSRQLPEGFLPLIEGL